MKAGHTHAAQESVALDSWHCHYLLGFICVCGNNNEHASGAVKSGNLRAALNFNLKSWAAFGSEFFDPQLPPRKAVAFWEGFCDQPHLHICRHWHYLEIASLRKKPAVNCKFPDFFFFFSLCCPPLGREDCIPLSVFRCSTFCWAFLIWIIFVFYPG